MIARSIRQLYTLLDADDRQILGQFAVYAVLIFVAAMYVALTAGWAWSLFEWASP